MRIPKRDLLELASGLGTGRNRDRRDIPAFALPPRVDASIASAAATWSPHLAFPWDVPLVDGNRRKELTPLRGACASRDALRCPEARRRGFTRGSPSSSHPRHAYCSRERDRATTKYEARAARSEWVVTRRDAARRLSRGGGERNALLRLSSEGGSAAERRGGAKAADHSRRAPLWGCFASSPISIRSTASRRFTSYAIF